MKLISCELQAFGAFNQLTYTFKDGLNLFEGANETGKTTLLHFIEGMLYGFYNPDLKVRKTQFPYERYERPDGRYQGALTLEHAGETYRIERDFKAHQVRVLRDKTGEDITGSLPQHAVLRQADLGAWLDLPYAFFVNSLSMTQQHLTPSDAASDFITARLQNLDATGSETLSYTKAMAYLNDKIKAIKNKGKTEAPLKQIHDQLTKLERTIERAQTTRDQMDQEETNVRAIQASIQTLEADKAQLNETLKRQEARDKRLKYEQSIIPLNEMTLQGYDTMYEAIKAYIHTCDASLRERCLRAFQAIDQASQTLEALEASKSSVKPLDQETYEAQTNAIWAWSKEEKKQSDLTQALQNLRLEQKEESLAQYEASLKALEEPTKPPLPKVYLWVLIVPLINYVKARRRYHQAHSTYQATKTLIEDRMQSERVALEKAQKEAEKLHQAREAVLENIHRIKTTYGLEEGTSHYAMATLERQAKATKDHQETQSRIDALKRTMVSKHQEIKPLTTLFKGTDFHQLERFVKTLHRLEQSLKGSLEPWFESLDLNADVAVEGSLETTKQALEATHANLTQAKETLARAEGTLSALEARSQNLSVLYGEQEALIQQKEDYEAFINTCERAKVRLERAAKKNEDNFAPKMAENMSAVLKALTLNRYDTLKIRQSLTFKVKDGEGTLQEAPYFSTGTRDQVVLAIRLGLLKTLEKTHYPLFFDDVFAYFDDARLSECLRYLKDHHQHQWFIFTAHKREKTLLKALQIPYHSLTKEEII